MREADRLHDDTVVATVMSNLGFKLAMGASGHRVVQTAVGDRYVLEAMQADGYALGGEQSGHVIMLDHATTGDGMLTGLHLLARVAATRPPLAELAAVMTRLPQVLVNVRASTSARVDDASRARPWPRRSAELGDTGRVLLRPSGTEPLVRVMVEAAEPRRPRPWPPAGRRGAGAARAGPAADRGSCPYTPPAPAAQHPAPPPPPSPRRRPVRRRWAAGASSTCRSG